jgi:hypothetical protein
MKLTNGHIVTRQLLRKRLSSSKHRLSFYEILVKMRAKTMGIATNSIMEMETRVNTSCVATRKYFALIIKNMHISDKIFCKRCSWRRTLLLTIWIKEPKLLPLPESNWRHIIAFACRTTAGTLLRQNWEESVMNGTCFHSQHK